MATTADTGGEAPRAFPPGAAWRAPLLEVGVFLLAILVFAQYGLHGALQRDDAVLLYAGQQLEEGVPPYRSAATLKGPVAQLVAGLGAVAARAAGRDDVLTVRALFLLLAALTVALVARLGGDVWGSPRAGLFAALAVMGSVGYARLAASGPRYATVMLLFLVLGILLTVRRGWFGAGAAGSLAYLTWQRARCSPSPPSRSPPSSPGAAGRARPRRPASPSRSRP